MFQSKLKITVYLLIILVLTGVSGIQAQDLTRLLKAVEQVEANLNKLIEQETAARQQAIADLRTDMSGLTGDKTRQNNTTATNDLSSLKKDIQALKNKMTGILAELEAIPVLSDQLAQVSASLIQMQALNESRQEAVDPEPVQLVSTDDVLVVNPFAENDQRMSLNDALCVLDEKISRLTEFEQELIQRTTPPSNEQNALTQPWDFSLNGFVDASNYTDFNSRESSFGLDQSEIDLAKTFSNKASLQADIEFLSDGTGGFDLDLEQGFLSYNPGQSNNWTFTFGKFNAPIGFELLDPPDMFQYSHALVFDLGLPTNLTGLSVSNQLSSKVDWVFYVVNGWDVNSDNNKEKTFGTRWGYTPRDNFGIGLSVICGAERDDNNSSRRTVLDFDLSWQLTPLWMIGGEYNYGMETKALANGTDGCWDGFLLMTKVDLSEISAITFRLDYFNDNDGLRTGEAQTLTALCVSPSVAIVDGLAGLFELRYDCSSIKSFEDTHGDPQHSQVSTGLEFTYAF